MDLRPLDRLRSLLAEAGDALITFSGGVDSALLARAAHDVLGERSVALTADSPSLPREELEAASRLASEIGIRHLVVPAKELEREGYVANAGDRCYHCKTELFDIALAQADSLGIRWVMDGTISDDLGDDRPGLRAAAEHRVRHPLVEAGFDKARVRAAARSLGISAWDKPSFACLGSRFPPGTRVTPGRLARVERIERILRLHGLRQFRVRFHELDGAALARIEVEPSDLPFVVSEGLRSAIAGACRQEGFRWVTLDLDGYRGGGARP